MELQEHLSSFSPRSFERREHSWEAAHVFFLQTNDQHYEGGPTSPEHFYQTVVHAQALLQHLEEHGDFFLKNEHLTTKELACIIRLIRAMDSSFVQKALASLIDAPETTPSSLIYQLKRKHPEGTVDFIRGNNHTAINHQALAKKMAASERTHLLSVSDSHRTTADMFRALRIDEWDYSPKETALLSFDHHTDTYTISGIGPQKANVMRWLIEEKYIAKLGVVGTQSVALGDRMEEATFIEGASLYDVHGKPDRDALETQLDRLFREWSASGIKEIYLSVDLDGLRLDELGYTSTDYGIERRQWEALQRLARAEPHIFDPTVDPRLKTKIWQSVRHAIASFPIKQKPYHGVPASWILFAARLAQESPYDFQIGITDARTGRKVIGDITEVSGGDRRRHGERITIALLEALVKEATKEL